MSGTRRLALRASTLTLRTKTKILIANPAPGGNGVTTRHNAERFIRRGAARLDTAGKLHFLRDEYPPELPSSIFVPPCFGATSKPELSLGGQIAEYNLFRDRAFRWKPQSSGGVLVVQAHGGISQAALKRAGA